MGASMTKMELIMELLRSQWTGEVAVTDNFGNLYKINHVGRMGEYPALRLIEWESPPVQDQKFEPTPKPTIGVENCGNCKFFKQTEEKDILRGYCRRFPPSIETGGMSKLFPLVYCETWCGEHQPKEV